VRNVALLLAYDGTDFVGSQLQSQGRSVQGALEEAWEEFTQERKRFTLAGRTDAGVHAHGQVANLQTATRHPLNTVQRGMSASWRRRRSGRTFTRATAQPGATIAT
jgi:tRNA pseudouridine38-40 synthase